MFAMRIWNNAQSRLRSGLNTMLSEQLPHELQFPNEIGDETPKRLE